jgi:2-haloacid dehalogenase
MLDGVVAHCGLGGYLQAVISVDAVRMFKPAPQVYALGPAALGLPKEALGFVSSNGWDVAGAKAYGFQVAWVNRLRAPLEELGLAPDLEVPDLEGLARALGR